MNRSIAVFKTVVLLIAIIASAIVLSNQCIVMASEPLYVEGFNADEPIDIGGTYLAEWWGLLYTPTISYSLKKVELIAGRGTGTYYIQLRPDDGGWPSDTILAATSFTMVDAIGWQGAEFAESYPLTARTKYWIVFKPVAGSHASLADSGDRIEYVVGEYSWPRIVWYARGDLQWMAKFYADGVCGFDEYFYNPPPIPTPIPLPPPVICSSFDSDDDGFDDAVRGKMNVDTTYWGALTVTVEAFLIDWRGGAEIIDADSISWSIAADEIEWVYVELYVPEEYPLGEGNFDFSLHLRDGCWNFEDEYSEFFHLYPPGMEPASAHVYIEHTYRGDLIVDIGVGDPASPEWSWRIWDRAGGSLDDLDLTVDLTAATAYLPPTTSNRWFLKVYDAAAGDTGQITEFTITYAGTTHTSDDPTVPINDFETSYAYIPSFTASAHIYIEHTYRGDLIVDIGVGDPAGPAWSQRVWNGEGGGLDNLDLTVDLSAAVAYLPPSETDRWFLKVYDRYGGDRGQIVEFTITYMTTTHSSDDVPVPINDLQPSYAFIPTPSAYAHIYIQHTYRGDLIVDLGVGDPSNPDYSVRIWNGEGGSADDLDLIVDLSALVGHVPPGTYDLWVKVYDRYSRDQGQIAIFTIRYQRETYSSPDVPVPIRDLQTSYAFITLSVS